MQEPSSWSVRGPCRGSDDPSGQDPVGAFPKTGRQTPPVGLGGQRRSGDVQLSGIHALLGVLPQRELDREVEDGGQPVHAGSQDDCPMVPAAPPRPGEGTARRTVPETPWALRILRAHGQQPVVVPFPIRGAPAVAQVALSAAARVAWNTRLVQPAVETLPLAVRPCGPLRMPWRSEVIT